MRIANWDCCGGCSWTLRNGVLFLVFVIALGPVVKGLRPLRESSQTWGDEWLFNRRDDDLSLNTAWNITGIYRGTWGIRDSNNNSSCLLQFEKSNGIAILELASSPTKITEVHYVQGVISFHDAFDNNDSGASQLRVEGVYMWTFKQLRMVVNSRKDGELTREDDYVLSNPYHLLGIFSSQVFQDSAREKIRRRKRSSSFDIEKRCNLEIAAQISRISSGQYDGDRERYQLVGSMEGPSVDDDDRVCFSPMLLNATSVNIEVYYNKAVNYTLMVTFISFMQVLLLIRQMEHSNTQSGAAKVSILVIGQQAIMDAYLCLLHLTAGILVESLFNAFATAAFFKFVVFSIFEMRYLLAIWKANRPMNNGEGWETLRRELSVLYSRFYGILLGGILIMYELHNFIKPILLILFSFWIPQIVTNVVRDSRKPLHPHYIIGMTITRLAIPLYVFGCPNNFMRIENDKYWCICLGIFMGLQASILLLQHYLGSRWFIPHQILPEKYSYYRRIDHDTNNGTDCVICMTSIDHRSNDCMVTPCDHFFHSGCLQRWMDIKMECPTCRRALPPA
ncbi:hypothetical protein Syun_008489 [Stephania yunnanensis]|uniref:RING-type E3 ubiquitin transferase n=1 Tax=Stephania yunnanensis TaxID=152371 RepID=A0AAP0KFD0_9MAGN